MLHVHIALQEIRRVENANAKLDGAASRASTGFSCVIAVSQLTEVAAGWRNWRAIQGPRPGEASVNRSAAMAARGDGSCRPLRSAVPACAYSAVRSGCCDHQFWPSGSPRLRDPRTGWRDCPAMCRPAQTLSPQPAKQRSISKRIGIILGELTKQTVPSSGRFPQSGSLARTDCRRPGEARSMSRVGSVGASEFAKC